MHVVLSNLRKATGDRRANPPFLLISQEATQFNAESDHSLDVAEFTHLADGQMPGGSRRRSRCTNKINTIILVLINI